MRLADVLRIVKPIVGALLLGFVVVWILGNDETVTRIGVPALVYSILISGSTVMLNAMVLKLSVECFKGSLTHKNAIRLSALGTLGNALGGLPIGTTLKYTLLHRNSGIKISEITASLVLFTLASSCWLLAYAALCVQYTSLDTAVKVAIPLLLCFTVAVLVVVLRWAKTQRRLGPLVKPFVLEPNLRRILLLSFAVTTTFIANYTVVAYFMFPEIHSFVVAFVAAAGTFIGLGSALQSVGGVTELAMAFSSWFSGLDVITGAMLALVLRFTAIIAAAVALAGLSLPTKRRR